MADEELIRLRGVLFRSTIRGGHASLAIIVTTSDKDEDDHNTSSHHDTQNNNEERMVLVVVRLGGSEWDTKLEKKVQSNNNEYPSIDQGNDNNMMPQLRSNIRRICKIGNEIEFLGQFAQPVSNESKASDKQVPNEKTYWQNWKRFMVDYNLPTSNPSESNVRIYQVQKWNVTQCQATRAKYFVPPRKKQKQKQTDRIKNPINGNIDSDNVRKNTSYGEIQQSTSRHHGGGIGKRRQGEIVCDFLLWMLSSTTTSSTTTENETQCEQLQCATKAFQVEKEHQDLGDQQYLFMKRWVPLDPSLSLGDHQSSVANKNSMSAKMISKDEDTTNNQVNDTNAEIGKGRIIDAAGGAGHVSLALALRGIHSTVVDPRQNVGKLPGRDRKALKKSKQEPFSTYRAWFGSRPSGVDSFFREGTDSSTSNATTTENRECNKTFTTMDGIAVSEDPLLLPICSMCSEDNLLPNCKAIVALHPDEATGSIVETAVENEIPFLVVPCCVFTRLFPERIKPQLNDNRASGSSTGRDNNTIVSTYYELIDWLVAKHSDIKVTQLPFEGANIAVWATFR